MFMIKHQIQKKSGQHSIQINKKNSQKSCYLFNILHVLPDSLISNLNHKKIQINIETVFLSCIFINVFNTINFLYDV